MAAKRRSYDTPKATTSQEKAIPKATTNQEEAIPKLKVRTITLENKKPVCTITNEEETSEDVNRQPAPAPVFTPPRPIVSVPEGEEKAKLERRSKELYAQLAAQQKVLNEIEAVADSVRIELHRIQKYLSRVQMKLMGRVPLF